MPTRQRPETLPVLGSAAIGNLERQHEARDGAGFKRPRVFERLLFELISFRQTHDRAHRFLRDLLPDSLDRFIAARHAVQEQSPRNPRGKIDTTKHFVFVVFNQWIFAKGFLTVIGRREQRCKSTYAEPQRPLKEPASIFSIPDRPVFSAPAKSRKLFLPQQAL